MLGFLTKKDFKKLHSSGKLGLLRGGLRLTAEEVQFQVRRCIVNGLDISKDTITHTSTVNLDDQGDYCKVQCYGFPYADQHYYITETVIDNAKSDSTSRNNREFSCNLYLKLPKEV